MYFQDVVYIVSNMVVPIIVIIIAILGMILLYRGKLGKLEIGNIDKISSLVNEAEDIRDSKHKSGKQYALLQEYHAQGLAQSKISFWFSLIFAAIGFLIIIISVLSHIFMPPSETSEAVKNATFLDSASKPIFAVVAGTIIDAVAALFFVQSNKARQLMTEFFDKLRTDRKLDESLKVLEQIEDKDISSRVKALLALNFAEINVSDDVFRRVVSMESITASTANKDSMKASQ
ncbi:TRADD-N-associated membrane domain-containing protein [Photobacterium leiognathi]|uniref:TRADD-N-associated membrane domain-containing protein n=1 Tax=Photobacterium leiognathi TaxID=553611 RepID=UPI002982231D|nr:hypothetical protein [Photobacterium leiognathi]